MSRSVHKGPFLCHVLLNKIKLISMTEYCVFLFKLFEKLNIILFFVFKNTFNYFF